MNKSELYNKINNQILDKLNEGIIPWEKSWTVGLPANFISKRNYRGINFITYFVIRLFLFWANYLKPLYNKKV
jgi:antirestriction protein ArdC